MSELDPRNGTLACEETGDRPQVLDLRVAPQPQVAMCPSAILFDGVFGRIQMGPADGSVSEPYKRWEEMRIDDAGNLRIPGAAPALATDLYGVCMGPKTDGAHPWSRWTRFRR